jgi:hypothetical protein
VAISLSLAALRGQLFANQAFWMPSFYHILSILAMLLTYLNAYTKKLPGTFANQGVLRLDRLW